MKHEESTTIEDVLGKTTQELKLLSSIEDARALLPEDAKIYHKKKIPKKGILVAISSSNTNPNKISIRMIENKEVLNWYQGRDLMKDGVKEVYHFQKRKD